MACQTSNTGTPSVPGLGVSGCVPSVSGMDRIAAVAGAAEAADGAAPLDEATWLTLRHHPESVTTWVRDDGFASTIVGMSRPERVPVTVAAAQAALPDDLFAELETLLPAPEHWLDAPL